MKLNRIISLITLTILIISCSKDDAAVLPTQNGTPTTEIPQPVENKGNKSPELFSIIDVTNGSKEVDLMPSFSWQPALDPEGESVTYDLYLDADQEPTTLIAENLVEPKFSMTERLHLITDYKWKVVAKDAKGAQTSSETNSFTTRNLRVSVNPLTYISAFSDREGYAMIVFQEKLWLIGGYDDDLGEYYNDVWNSEDGLNWTKVTPNTPIKNKPQFPPRSQHSSVVFNNKIWVIAGRIGSERKNDIWYSEDGISWIEATPEASFEPRFNHTSEAFDGKIWVIKGERQTDVWSSVDGLNWEQTTSDIGILADDYHSSTVFLDKLWLFAGHDYFEQKIQITNSNNGSIWLDNSQGDTFFSTYGHASLAFDDKIYVIGGIGNDDTVAALRYSIDGNDWTIISPENNNLRFAAPKATIFKDKIWIIDSYGQIWALE